MEPGSSRRIRESRSWRSRRSGSFPLGGFDVAFEIVEPGRPEDPVVLEPPLDVSEWGRVERIEAGLGGPPLPEEPCLAEHSDVFGDGRPADREEGGEVAGRPFAAAEGVEDGAPGGVGDGGKDRRGFCNHMVTD